MVAGQHQTPENGAAEVRSGRIQARLDELQRFQMGLLNRLQVSGQTAYYIDYEDVLDLKVINGLAAFLGVEGRLDELVFKFKKQNPEPLADKVANPPKWRWGWPSSTGST